MSHAGLAKLSAHGANLADLNMSEFLTCVRALVCRSDKKFQEIFQKAGLRLVRMETQKGFPKELFPVKVYALKPQDAELK